MDDDMDDVDDHTVNIMDVNLARAPVPATNDGNVNRHLHAEQYELNANRNVHRSIQCVCPTS